MYKRPYYKEISKRLAEPRRFIQVISGPRQVGKTTLARQAMDGYGHPSHYASADEPLLRDLSWIGQQWEIGRINARESKETLLVIDEVQKIDGWSEAIKALWDEDTRDGTKLKVILLGSSPLLVQSGLSESLAGRFETIRLPHWAYSEMHDAFGWDLETYIYFGGYPGSAPLVEDEQRWKRYIVDSLIETSISKDILLMTRVDKPALLRRLFQLGCDYSGQILSYQKMIGQLQDAGNTTTLAHYLQLLSGAGMLTGLDKYAGQSARRRGSSPKLQVLNNALMTATSDLTFKEARIKLDYWGRLVESAVGAYLCNAMSTTNAKVTYWRERSMEVDFVIIYGRKVTAIEVKSERRRESTAGVAAFIKSFPQSKALLVGGGGMPLDQFLKMPAEELLKI